MLQMRRTFLAAFAGCRSNALTRASNSRLLNGLTKKSSAPLSRGRHALVDGAIGGYDEKGRPQTLPTQAADYLVARSLGIRQAGIEDDQFILDARDNAAELLGSPGDVDAVPDLSASALTVLQLPVVLGDQ
jgi:hypothetical protein